MLPDKWEVVGLVKELTIYPLKSGRGLSVKRAEATRWGLASGEMQDRCFLAVTASGATFITGRQAGKLLGVRLTYENGIITLQADGAATITCDIKDFLNNPMVVESKIWGQAVRGVDCGEEAARWLSEVLYKGEMGVRLLYTAKVMKSRPPRRLDYYDFPQIQNNDTMYYADTSAYNVASQSSLEDLNSRLAQPIEMKNFRPNIVICRAPPFAEDDWLYLKIGDAVFRKIKPCERCLLTTVDPKSYERDPNQEPLSTLRTYRLIMDPPKLAKVWATKPVFGANMAIDIGGSISVGDKVFAATVSKNPSFSIFHDMD